MVPEDEQLVPGNHDLRTAKIAPVESMNILKLAASPKKAEKKNVH